MKRAQVLHGFIHFIFDAKDYPSPPWPPDSQGNIPVIIDLVGDNAEAREGDGWNPETGKVVHRPEVEWDPKEYEFHIT